MAPFSDLSKNHKGFFQNAKTIAMKRHRYDPSFDVVPKTVFFDIVAGLTLRLAS